MPSPFASRHTQDVTAPSGTTYKIQKLSHVSLEAAAKERQGVVISNMRAMGGEIAKTFGELRAQVKDELEKVKTEAELWQERLTNYDRLTVLLAGVVGWDVKGDEGGAVKLSRDRIADLVEEDAQVVFEAIVRYSTPPIDVKLIESAEGKGEEPSTGI